MSVTRFIGLLGWVGTAGAVPLAAQTQIWLPAACDIKPGHQLVNSGMQSLRSAFSTKFADQKAKDLKDAERSLTQAVTTGKQEKNAAAWYYLGRYYLMVEDLAGADSALSKALALAPTCKEDIGLYRRQAWVPVFNAAAAAWQAGNTDSAIVAFRRANEIYQAEPMGFIYLADLFVSRPEPDSALKRTDVAKYRTDSLEYAARMDSAVKYFKLAVPAASDPKYAKDRREAFLNVARVYHQAERYAEAAAAYHEYLAAYPNDVQGTASLAELYLRANRTDSALALYSRVLDHTDSATAEDLFAAARSLLSVIPSLPDTAVMDADCAKAAKKKSPALTARQVAARCAPAAADTMRKYHAVVDPEYRLVARTYEAGLTKNPYARDALYNLAGVSYTIGDTASVLGLAQRLYALDPMNRSTLAKLVGGWQLKGKKDSVLYYLTIADSLPVEVTISRFAPTEKGASLDGQVTNVRPRASPPVKITFDFLDAKGNAVATQSQDVPALEPNASREFKLKVEQAGVVAWRYKRG